MKFTKYIFIPNLIFVGLIFFGFFGTVNADVPCDPTYPSSVCNMGPSGGCNQGSFVSGITCRDSDCPVGWYATCAYSYNICRDGNLVSGIGQLQACGPTASSCVCNYPSGGGGGGNTPDFTISLNPYTITASQGQSASYQVTITSIDGFTGSVSLNTDNCPQSASCSFTAPSVSVSPGVNGTSIYNVTNTSVSPTGTHTMNISGNAPSIGVTKSTPAYLILNSNGTNDASCVSVTAPSSVNAGQSFGASVVTNNNGTKVWSSTAVVGSAYAHKLGALNDTTRWGLTRVDLPTNTVNPGSNATFNFNATAPANPAGAGCTLISGASYSCPFDWKMLQESVQWFGATCSKAGGITVVTAQAPTLNFSGNPLTGTSPLTSTLTWSTGNSPTSCTASASPSNSGWTGSKALSGSQNVTTSVTTTYTLTCSNTAGSTSKTVTITPGASGSANVTMYADPTSAYVGYGVGIYWTYNNATSCTLNPGSLGTISSYPSGSGGAFSGNYSSAGTYNYSISCNPSGANSTASVSVPVNNLPPPSTATLTVIKSGQGTVTSSPAGISCGGTCSSSFTQGTSVTLTATPATGRIFTGWSGGGCSGRGQCTTVLNSNTTIYANFAVDPNYQEF